MNFNNPEEITKYVNAATSVIMGVDDVVRAFKDMPRRPSYQRYMNKQMGIEDTGSLEYLLKQAGYVPDPNADEENKESETPQEKLEKDMIGEAAQAEDGLDLEAIDAYMGAVKPIQRGDFYRQ